MRRGRASGQAQSSAKSSQRVTSVTDGPSGCQRAAVAVLTVANLILCIACLRYLRQLWQAEDAALSSDFVELDWSKLYDPPPVKGAALAETPSVAEVQLPSPDAAPPRLRQPLDRRSNVPASSPAKAAELPQTKSEKASVPADAGPSASSNSAVQQSSQQEEHPALPDMPTMNVAAQLRPSVASKCHVCGAKVVGPLPTTLDKGKLSAASGCAWEQKPGVFLFGYAGNVERSDRLDVMKEVCFELGDLCAGVTCTGSGASAQETSCTVRSPGPLKASKTERTYLKTCKPNEGPDCGEQDGPAPSPPLDRMSADLHGSAVVILAHNREADLKACLDSLLSLPEASLFKVHVSLDDPNSWDAMRAAVQKVASAHGQGHRVDVSTWTVEELVPDPSKHNKEIMRWFKMNAGKIAHHYWVAFEKTFMELQYEYAIFVEEDLVFSPDFLSLFRSTAGLLEKDPSIWCVGAWNDFGYTGTAVDSCRLQRTSYFPGLGFLLPRQVWLQIREEWPIAPTMGWDYWMRVAFRKADKECIVPEVSRSHHASKHGSSIKGAKQLLLFEQMALADIPTTCDVSEPCDHFGNVSYLLAEEYEARMRSIIDDAPRLTPQELKAGRQVPATLYVVPYEREHYGSLASQVGLQPKGTKGSIPQDVRSEHYGVVAGRITNQRTPVLLVDRRSPKGYLKQAEQLRLLERTLVTGAAMGQSCSEACNDRKMLCDKEQLYFLNDCNILQQHFPCEAGCAHQVGKELPVYVPDSFQPTYRQCLVTFISPMNCEAKHPSTSRLCACTPRS